MSSNMSLCSLDLEMICLEMFIFNQNSKMVQLLKNKFLYCIKLLNCNFYKHNSLEAWFPRPSFQAEISH